MTKTCNDANATDRQDGKGSRRKSRARCGGARQEGDRRRRARPASHAGVHRLLRAVLGPEQPAGQGDRRQHRGHAARCGRAAGARRRLRSRRVDPDGFLHLIVHVFAPHTRDFYALERLWGDADRIEMKDEPPAPKKRSSAKASRDEVGAQSGFHFSALRLADGSSRCSSRRRAPPAELPSHNRRAGRSATNAGTASPGSRRLCAIAAATRCPRGAAGLSDGGCCARCRRTRRR